METLSETFQALGDPTRLRILRLVAAARLNVSELVSLVGVSQSSVSHHLARLKALELVREERQGGFSYYALCVDSGEPRWPLVRLAREAPDVHGDGARLTELLRRRDDRHTLNERLLEPGQSWMLWAAAVASLVPPVDVADFGCGTGVLTVELARWARSVVAVDRSAAALEQARARLAAEVAQAAAPPPHGGAPARCPVRFVEADLHALPSELGPVDLVVISQSLHHVDEPERVLGEAARLLRPGGRLWLLELSPHEERWVQARLGHRHLGFEPRQLEGLLRGAGFDALRFTPSPRDGASPFRPFLFTARRPPGRSRPPRQARPNPRGASGPRRTTGSQPP